MTITYYGHIANVVFAYDVEGFYLVDFATRDGIEYGIYQAPYSSAFYAVKR